MTEAELAQTGGDGHAAVAGQPRLDHLALASDRAWDNVVRYCRQLGARWLGGPTDPATDPFYFCQVGFRDGTKLEFVEPYPGEGSDFVRRFLHRNGPGPHHLTFKVTDIEAVMTGAERAGYRIVNQSLDDPDWKEAFLHPKESHGIVIQLAQPGDETGWEDPAPLPPTEQGDSSTIDGVTHLVADLDRAVELFTEVLGMELGHRDDGGRGEQPPRRHPGPAARLTSGPWSLALLSPTSGPAAHWLGDRAGRLLQVEMSVDHLGPVPDLRPIPGGHELPPSKNLGTRVLLRRNGPTGS